MDPAIAARTLDSSNQVFHSGFRTPSPKRRKWLYQLLGRLPEVERVIMAMHLQSETQRSIASCVGMTQPGVHYRLHAAKRRLQLLARLPCPPVTREEVVALGVAERDAEILVRLQSARAERVQRDLGIRWRGYVTLRVRVMRASVPPTAERVRALLDLVGVRHLGVEPSHRAYKDPLVTGPRRK